jgi:hypothetical protein
MNGLCKKPTAPQKAIHTDKWAEIVCRKLTSQVARRWRLVNVRGPKGRESAGIVDLVAIRRNTSRPIGKILKSGDLFDLILVQMKGGRAPKPTPREETRLRRVLKKYRAIDIVLYEWKLEELSRFSRLVNGKWEETSAEEIFG